MFRRVAPELSFCTEARSSESSAPLCVEANLFTRTRGASLRPLPAWVNGFGAVHGRLRLRARGPSCVPGGRRPQPVVCAVVPEAPRERTTAAPSALDQRRRAEARTASRPKRRDGNQASAAFGPEALCQTQARHSLRDVLWAFLLPLPPLRPRRRGPATPPALLLRQGPTSRTALPLRPPLPPNPSALSGSSSSSSRPIITIQ